jgi:hypothetical protein
MFPLKNQRSALHEVILKGCPFCMAPIGVDTRLTLLKKEQGAVSIVEVGDDLSTLKICCKACHMMWHWTLRLHAPHHDGEIEQVEWRLCPRAQRHQSKKGVSDCEFDGVPVYYKGEILYASTMDCIEITWHELNLPLEERTFFTSVETAEQVLRSPGEVYSNMRRALGLTGYFAPIRDPDFYRCLCGASMRRITHPLTSHTHLTGQSKIKPLREVCSCGIVIMILSDSVTQLREQANKLATYREVHSYASSFIAVSKRGEVLVNQTRKTTPLEELYTWTRLELLWDRCVSLRGQGGALTLVEPSQRGALTLSAHTGGELTLSQGEEVTLAPLTLWERFKRWLGLRR